MQQYVMKSYLDILKELAKAHQVPLITAFKNASLPTSTYYRTIQAKTELRYATAKKVKEAIEELYALQQARDYTERLRANGDIINRRSIRAKFKPRSIST
jgi:predicted transcriptional regulator